MVALTLPDMRAHRGIQERQGHSICCTDCLNVATVSAPWRMEGGALKLLPHGVFFTLPSCRQGTPLHASAQVP